MKRNLFGLFIVMLLAACAPNTPIATPTALATTTIPPEDAAALTNIQTQYKTWMRVNPEPIKFPGWLATLCRMPSADEQARLNSPHSVEFSNIYVNPIGAATIALTDKRVFPVGSMIVKEKLLKVDDKVADALGIMIKQKSGYNPEGGDWEYAYLDENGNMQYGIEAGQQCQTCHIGTSISPEMDAYYRKSGASVARKAMDSVFSTFPFAPDH